MTEKVSKLNSLFERRNLIQNSLVELCFNKIAFCTKYSRGFFAEVDNMDEEFLLDLKTQAVKYLEDKILEIDKELENL